MADVHEPEVRSYNMSRIKGKDTKPEILVRKYLHAKGFRFKLHDTALPGKPDLVLPKYGTVINIHGCFWHGHEGCQYFKLPSTRGECWEAKINATRGRDKVNSKKLFDLNWSEIIIWECDLKNQFESTMKYVLKELKNE